MITRAHVRTATASLLLLAAAAGAPDAFAQDGESPRNPAPDSHVVSQDELEALMLEKAERIEADRAVLRSFLSRPEVHDLATSSGIDVRRAETAVSMLEPGEAARLAGMAEPLDAALAGGDRIVIGTTTLIIALLVLIIILVA